MIAFKRSAQVTTVEWNKPAMFRHSLCPNVDARFPSAEHVCLLAKVTVDDR
jgi:hypothetical protein